MEFFSRVRGFLPSKRIGALLLITAAFIVAVVIFKYPSSAKEVVIQPLRLASTTPQIAEKDTDSDGVPDWEEELWGLSAVRADSDADGIGDKEEIENKKKLVADVPNQVLAESQADISATPQNLAARTLLSQYLLSKQAGLPIDQDTVASAGDIALSAAAGKLTYKTYTSSDIIIAASSDTSALKTYGNMLGVALENKTGTSSPHELFILLSYGQSADANALKENMAKVVARYQSTIDGFLTTPVPSAVVNIHLSLLNSLERVKTDLSGMGDVGGNAVAAFASFSAYTEDSTLLAQSFAQLKATFETNHITFESSEPGHVLMTSSPTN